MSDERLKIASNYGLSDELACLEMPNDISVSLRTQNTRRIGASIMLEHLLGGEWDQSSREEVREFLGRVLANAERQGIRLYDTAAAEPQVVRASSDTYLSPC